MKKRIIAGTLTLCVVLSCSAAVFADDEAKLPFMGEGRMKLNRIEREAGWGVNGEERPEMPEWAEGTEMPERGGMRGRGFDISVYEQYGLTFDKENGGFHYEGKLVGIFVDGQGKGIPMFNQDGEVHVKAIRDEDGNLTGIAELSADEYNTIISEMETMKSEEGMFGRKGRQLDISAYEQYGLTLDKENGGFYYEGKLVGLFVDGQGRGIQKFNQDGEVHVKAIRDDDGNLTGITELSADEYNTVFSEMEAMKSEMEAKRAEMEALMEEKGLEAGQRMEGFKNFKANRSFTDLNE